MSFTTTGKVANPNQEVAAHIQLIRNEGLFANLPGISLGAAVYQLDGALTLENLSFCHQVKHGQVSTVFSCSRLQYQFILL